MTLFPDFAAFASALRADGVVMGHPLTLSLNLHLNANVDACQLRYRDVCDALGVPWELSTRAAAMDEHALEVTDAVGARGEARGGARGAQELVSYARGDCV